MKKKMKKVVKGMTLLECIIALLVAGICGTLMAVIVTESMKFMRNANHTNTKVAAEAPVAAVQNVSTLYDTTGTTDPSEPVATAPAAQDVNITVSAGGRSATIGSQKYDTSCMANRSKGDTSTQLDVDLQFYVIETQTETTPATT
jgi:prepilin-type N-terminal cleavage/methylation domain-containing protein